jgi:hypothetical protein
MEGIERKLSGEGKLTRAAALAWRGGFLGGRRKILMGLLVWWGEEAWNLYMGKDGAQLRQGEGRAGWQQSESTQQHWPLRRQSRALLYPNIQVFWGVVCKNGKKKRDKEFPATMAIPLVR